MQPRLNHFVVRPDTKDGMPGPIVPLIAVDQLPDWMQLAGVPRELDAEQTIGLTNLGIVEMEEDSFFDVRLHHDKIRAILDRADETKDLYSAGYEKAGAKATGHKRTSSLRDAKTKTSDKAASNDSLPTSPSASRHNIANAAVDVQARSSSNSNNERPARPHMREVTRDEPRPTGPQRTLARQYKQPITAFCRHWCCHGTCKWGFKCRYVHRMPTTVEGLREVGLKDFPTWYLLMMSDAGSGSSGLSRTDAVLEPDSPCSNKQELKQIREMLHLLLRGEQPTHGQQQSRPHKNSSNANMYTNASVAANAASIRQQAERQQQARDNMLVMRDRTRPRPSVEDGRDGVGGGGRTLLPAMKGGRASNECAGVRDMRSPGFLARRAGFGEEKLVDID